MAEYWIEYTIYRDDEVIGFGASGTTINLQDAVADIAADVDNHAWDTEDTMPDPQEVRAEIEAARLARHDEIDRGDI
jgi:hypothetical protein